MTHDELLDLLRQHIKHAGSITSFARRINVSQAYISEVLHGHQAPGPAILDALGVRKVVTYEPTGRPRENAIVPPLGLCDCGRPATRRVRLKVNRKTQEFMLCAKCAELEAQP